MLYDPNKDKNVGKTNPNPTWFEINLQKKKDKMILKKRMTS